MPSSHWADEPLDDDEDSFVRPYTITHGRTASAHGEDLKLITIIVTLAAAEERIDSRGLEPEHRFILDQCRRPAAVAEIAARLKLPVAVAKILISDLIAWDMVAARPPAALGDGRGPDIRLLRAVRDGLRRL